MNLSEDEVKKNLLFYFLFSRDFICATTEMSMFNGSCLADVIALSKNYKIYEVEIKTNTNDLKTELKTIEYIFSKEKEPEKYRHLAKKYKHSGYLNQNVEKDSFTPHRFYFSINFEDKDLALKILKDTKYGLMDHHGNVYKIAKDLHHNKIQENLVKKLLQKISRTNYNLLEKLEKDVKPRDIRTIQ